MQSSKKIMIGTPMYGGQCYGIYAKSLIEAIPFLKENGYEVEFVDLYNESLITRARNLIAHIFLKSDCDYLLFIDADQSFLGKDILRMIQHDKEIIAAPVPRKIINWENVAKAVSNGKSNYEAYSGSFNIRTSSNPNNNEGGIKFREPLEVDSVGTGMMIIKREVFEKLSPGLENFKSYSEISPYLGHDDAVVEFFNTKIVNGELLSEDYNFCQMWRNIGGKVYVDLLAKVKHMGTYAFSGTIIDHTKITE